MPPPVVLVAEDEPTLRSVVAECLRDEGYEVREVANGRLALELVRQEPVDVVLADLRMARLPGAVVDGGYYAKLLLFAITVTYSQAAGRRRLGESLHPARIHRQMRPCICEHEY